MSRSYLFSALLYHRATLYVHLENRSDLFLTLCTNLVLQALLLAYIPVRKNVSAICLMLSADRFPIRTFVVAAIAFAGLGAMVCGGHHVSSSVCSSYDDSRTSVLLRRSDYLIWMCYHLVGILFDDIKGFCFALILGLYCSDS